MKHADPIKALQDLVKRHGDSQKAAAKSLGIAPSYIHDLLNGRRQFSQAILDKLGLTRVVVRRSA